MSLSTMHIRSIFHGVSRGATPTTLKYHVLGLALHTPEGPQQERPRHSAKPPPCRPSGVIACDNLTFDAINQPVAFHTVYGDVRP